MQCEVQPLLAWCQVHITVNLLCLAAPLPQVAVDMEGEGMVSKSEAVLMVEPRHLDQLLHPMFEGARAGSCAGQGH